MTEQPQQGDSFRQLSESVSGIMRAGGDLQARIRDLMLEAFAAGQLDLQHIRAITRAVVDGIAAAGDHAGGAAVRQSLAGVAAALQQAAEASRLAIEEASGHAAEFSSHELKQAVADLGTIEQLFVDTLHDVATAGSATAAAIFGDYLEHIRRGNSDLANRLQEIVGELGKSLPAAAGTELQSGMELARGASAQLAGLASAALAALQQGLSPGRKRHPGNPPDTGEPG